METDKQRDRNADRHTKREINSETEVLIGNKETDKQTDRNSDSRQ